MIGFGILPWQLRGRARYEAGDAGVHRLVSAPFPKSRRRLNFWLPLALAIPVGVGMTFFGLSLGAGVPWAYLYGAGFAIVLAGVALAWAADSRTDTPPGVVLVEADLNRGSVHLGLGKQAIQGRPVDARWVAFGLNNPANPVQLREFVIYLAADGAESSRGFVVFWQINGYTPIEPLEQFSVACGIPFRSESDVVRSRGDMFKWEVIIRRTEVQRRPLDPSITPAAASSRAAARTGTPSTHREARRGSPR